ncbi:MAG: bifunctional folylpolyglutamate synthase/dihydrofolate synthase [Acidimicrobiales bacterium]
MIGYEAALAELEGRIDLEAILGARSARPPTLDRMAAVVHALGDPMRAYPVVHITGTNGKGSTARMVTSLLSAMGLVAGTYTSPDLERVNERIAIAGEPVSDDDFATAIGAVAAVEGLGGARLSRFELLTAAAYWLFADQAVDVAVVEVGLGGTFDATNVADGAVSVITNIALDHTELLGPTRRHIATEKAGIVKASSLAVVGETDPELVELFGGGEGMWIMGRDFGTSANVVAHGGRALDVWTPGASYDEVFLPLHGRHQGDNAAVALAAVEGFFAAPLPEEVVRQGFEDVTSPGRMEVLRRSPLVVLDGAHNPAGAMAAAAAVEEDLGDPRRLIVMGLLKGRDPSEMLSSIRATGAALLVACPPPSPRALAPEDLAAEAHKLGVRAVVAGDVAEALAIALGEAAEDDMVLVTGSLYVVGMARSLLRHGHPGQHAGRPGR